MIARNFVHSFGLLLHVRVFRSRRLSAQPTAGRTLAGRPEAASALQDRGMEVGDWRQTAGKAASSADTNGTGAGHGETGPGLISVRSNGRQRVSRTTQCSAVEARSRQPRSGGRQRGRTSGLTLWAPRNETAQSAGGAERRTRQSRVGPGGPGTCAAWAPCRGGDMLAARLWSRGDASARAKRSRRVVRAEWREPVPAAGQPG